MPRYDLSPLGSTGLKHYSGHIYEEFHRALQGRLGVQIYREMSDNDAIVGAFLYTIKSLIRQTEWRFEPADESPEAIRASEFMETVMGDMSHSWDELLSEILSMLVYGWSYFEVVYKVRKGRTAAPQFRSNHNDGMIGWRKISIRAQDSLDQWEIDEDGGIVGLWQNAPPRFQRVFIPIEKSLLFRTEMTRGNPEGRSVLRNAYRPWFFAKRLQEIEAIGAERDLAGLPVMEVPLELLSTNATSEQRALRGMFETLIQQVKRDQREGAIVPTELDREGNPTGYKLKLLSSGGRRQVDVNATIVRWETRIAQSVLADFIMLGQDSQTGSYALASSKTNMFSVALGAVLGNIASTFDRFAIPRLMRLNGFSSEVFPSLKHGDLETPDLSDISTFVTQLMSVGALRGDDRLERKLREMADLPQVDDQEI